MQAENDLASAEKSFEASLAVNPAYTAAMGMLGQVLMQTPEDAGGSPEVKMRAQDLFKQIIQITPSDADAMLSLGTSHHQLMELGPAKAAYERTVEMNPRMPMAYNNLAMLIEGGNRVEDAEKSLSLLRRGLEVCDARDPNYKLLASNRDRIAEYLPGLKSDIANQLEQPEEPTEGPFN
jgi:Tfp pilus assembly protein PilF